MKLQVLRQTLDDPALDTAVSRALLQSAGRGDIGATLRLYVPRRAVIFGRQDERSSNFQAAVAAAKGLGFESVVRLAGGRAAVFHEGTLALAWAIPASDPTTGTFARYREASELIASALEKIGVDATIGEIPGEYCPGEFSIGAPGPAGPIKLVGIGQRQIKGAAHVGAVIIVEDAASIREVLVGVYAALGLEWDPSTAGSINDLIEVDSARVAQAILDEFASRYDLEEQEISAEQIELAKELRSDHSVESA